MEKERRLPPYGKQAWFIEDCHVARIKRIAGAMVSLSRRLRMSGAWKIGAAQNKVFAAARLLDRSARFPVPSIKKATRTFFLLWIRGSACTRPL